MNYSVQRQLSVAIENQPGRLAAITKVMASRGINIKDLSVIDNVAVEFAGIFKDLPTDFAENHDHYIHGTPKRTKS